MIPARKNAFFNFGLRRVLSWILRRRFYNVYVAGREYLAGLPPGHPVVGCVSHTNWWDGFVLYVLSYRLLPQEIYLAMDETNLRRYPFFPWMGVFSVNLAGPARALAGVRYALQLLEDRKRSPLIWIFVQGALVTPNAPIDVKPGASFLARKAGALLLPVVIRYEWLSESRPSIFVVIGSPLEAAISEKELTDVMRQLAASVPASADAPEFATFQPLYPRQMSMNRWWDYLTHRWNGERAPFEARNR